MIKLKLYLILKRVRGSKQLIRFIENELDSFLSRRGFHILSYEVREDG